MKTRYIGLFAALTILLLVVVAQKYRWDKKETVIDAQSEILALYHNFSTADSITISGTITLFDEKVADKMQEKMDFFYMRSATGFISELGNLKTISDGKIVVQIDTVSKEILVFEDGSGQLLTDKKNIFPFEKLLTDTSEFKTRLEGKSDGELHTLTMASEREPDIKQVEVSYSPSDYKLSAASISWWKTQNPEDRKDEKNCWVTKINYRYGSTRVLNPQAEIATIVTIRDNEITRTDAYQNYQINIGN